MIKSMTGFGRGESVSEDCKVTVEIKAVNHRYCDLNMKLPRKLNYLEADIRSFLKQSIQRGKVDVFINYDFYLHAVLRLIFYIPRNLILCKIFIDIIYNCAIYFTY